MKNIIFMLGLIVFTISAYGGVDIFGKVVDEDGNAVTNATFYIMYYGGENETIKEKAKVDVRGCVNISFKSTVSNDYHYWADADGYYRSELKAQNLRIKETFIPFYKVTFLDKRIDNIVVLRKKVNPIPMDVASNIKNDKFPKIGEYLLFDLQKMDWLPPYGKGEVADLKLKCSLDTEDSDRYAGTDVEFIGKGSGMIVVPMDEKSIFRSPYNADPQADYRSSFRFDKKTAKSFDEGCVIARIRVVYNNDGSIKSAHYLKIYGLSLWGRLKTQGIYFNPTQNDTNLECDVSKSPDKGRRYRLLP